MLKSLWAAHSSLSRKSLPGIFSYTVLKTILSGQCRGLPDWIGTLCERFQYNNSCPGRQGVALVLSIRWIYRKNGYGSWKKVMRRSA